MLRGQKPEIRYRDIEIEKHTALSGTVKILRLNCKSAISISKENISSWSLSRHVVGRELIAYKITNFNEAPTSRSSRCLERTRQQRQWMSTGKGGEQVSRFGFGGGAARGDGVGGGRGHV